MQHALHPAFKQTNRLTYTFYRHASRRSFDRPLSRSPKKTALTPARASPQPLVTSDTAKFWKDNAARLQDEIKKRRNFFSATSASPRPWYLPNLPTSFYRLVPLGLRRLFTPWRIFFYVLFSYCGYWIYNRVYPWQTNPARVKILNPRFFYPFMVESRDVVSSTSAVVNMQNYPLGQDSRTIDAVWKTGVWSVHVKQPELQIIREYTPLPPTSKDMPPENLRLFVREEPKGEVSRMLHREPAGTIIHVRGPFPEFEVPDGLKEIVFLAGGTGIAPALQVAHCLFKARGLKAEELPRMKILWANRRREDSRNLLESDEVQQWRSSLWNRIRHFVTSAEGVRAKTVQLEEDGSLPRVQQSKLVDELEKFELESDGKITVEYFVDEEGSFINERVLRPLLHAEQSGAAPHQSKKAEKLLLISGPEGFIDHYAGPKEWSKGRALPGRLGGLLEHILPSEWSIWKL